MCALQTPVLTRFIHLRAPIPFVSSQEDFKAVVVEASGFVYAPERPKEDTFVGQKWGWTAKKAGACSAAVGWRKQMPPMQAQECRTALRLLGGHAMPAAPRCRPVHQSVRAICLLPATAPL